MTLHLSIVADVFTHEDQAKHALEALRQAGFAYDQIGIAMQGHEGIDLLNDLLNLGVSYEQASYYAQEVKAGHTVVSVRPDGREQEAHAIMRRSGAFTDANTATSGTPSTDKRREAWDQAVAAQQARLSAQTGTNAQEDFHRPRSLKPRAERQPMTTTSVQTEEGGLRPDAMMEQKPSVAAGVQNEVLTEQKLSNTPVVQDTVVAKQSPLVEEEHHEPATIDDEETLRRPRNQAHNSVESLPPQAPLEKLTNRKTVKTVLLVGGLLLGVSASVLLALLRGKQIRQFVLSTIQTMKK